MEPKIQYAKTSDGVNIAYWTLGEGEPAVVVMPSPPFSHIQLEWEWPQYRRWYERLAENRMIVRYDSRGSGLSDPEASDYSLDAHVLDLLAVVNHLQLSPFALLGYLDSGPVAIAYASRRPEHVCRLILWCTYARTLDQMEAPEAQADTALIGKDWKIYTETLARIATGWSADEEARKLAAFSREAVKEETAWAVIDELWQFDVTDLLPKVSMPSLVLHRRHYSYTRLDSARKLASRIPGAQLVILEGNTPIPFFGDMEGNLHAIDEFLSEGEEADAKPTTFVAEDVHTILFTDVEGSTALTDRLGDAKARELLREHEGVVREALKAYGGSEVKTMGDGFMASFSSATKALECAIAIQSAFAVRNESAEEPIKVRIGLNAGEPIAEDDPGGRGDLFGTAVNVAARVAAKAEGGEILLADVVRQLVAGKKFLFNDRGDTELRGFEDPVRVYEVRWREGD